MHCIQYLFIRCSLWPREDETGVLHAALTSFLDRIGPVLLPYATHGTIEVCSCSYSIRVLPPTLTRSIGYMIAIVLHIYCVSLCSRFSSVCCRVCIRRARRCGGRRRSRCAPFASTWPPRRRRARARGRVRRCTTCSGRSPFSSVRSCASLCCAFLFFSFCFFDSTLRGDYEDYESTRLDSAVV